MESIEAEVCVESGKSDRQGRRIRGAAEWSSILDHYDSSGLTQVAFCRREGLRFGTLVAWLGRRRKNGGVLFNGTVSEPGRVLVQQLDGSNNVIETTEAKLYGGNEFYANVDLPVGTNTVRIKATDIHGETSTQDYSVPVVSDSGDSFLYDDAGNLTTWTKSEGTVVEYTWDAANRLREVKVDSVSIKTFEYDGAGRMVRSSDGTQADDYFWDGLERLGREEFTISNGNVSIYRRYLAQGFTHSDGVNPVENYFTLRDHLGSIREVLDDSYATVAKYDYSAWGEVAKLSGSIDADRLYTGHLYFADADTPMHFAPYRAYQPELGKWLSRDLIGELGPDGPNVFGYSRNNPVLFSDLTGLYSVLGLEFDEGKGFFSNVGDYLGSARSGAKMGAAAYADGFLPGDPFENAGYYNSDCYGLGASRLLGNVGQFAAITALTAGAANAGYLANLSRFGSINKWSVQFGVRLNKSKQFLRFGVERHIINAFKGSKFPGAAPITHLQLGRLHVILNPLRWRSHGIFRL
jgi:RHS repeat-associated protein